MSVQDYRKAQKKRLSWAPLLISYCYCYRKAVVDSSYASDEMHAVIFLFLLLKPTPSCYFE